MVSILSQVIYITSQFTIGKSQVLFSISILIFFLPVQLHFTSEPFTFIKGVIQFIPL